jgi:hypothetical protein
MPGRFEKRVALVIMAKPYAERQVETGILPFITHQDCECGIYAVPQDVDLTALRGVRAYFGINMESEIARHLVLPMLRETLMVFQLMGMSGNLGDFMMSPEDAINDYKPIETDLENIVDFDRLEVRNPGSTTEAASEPEATNIEDAINQLEKWMQNPGEAN